MAGSTSCSTRGERSRSALVEERSPPPSGGLRTGGSVMARNARAHIEQIVTAIPTSRRSTRPCDCAARSSPSCAPSENESAGRSSSSPTPRGCREARSLASSQPSTAHASRPFTPSRASSATMWMCASSPGGYRSPDLPHTAAAACPPTPRVRLRGVARRACISSSDARAAILVTDPLMRSARLT